ncbi:MAG: HAD-IA family hydrolase [Candidatus Omnitrophota bacterium]
MQKISLIIFDFDGTLLDSQQDIVNGVNFALKSFGRPSQKASEILPFIGWGMEYLIVKSFGGGEEETLEKACVVFKDYFREHSLDNSVLYPGVKEILKHFEDKIKAIVTNRAYEFVLSALKAFNAGSYFKDIMSSDDKDCMKPSACPINKIVSKYKIDKKEALMVGDMEVDIQAGKEAGILTCGVTYGIGEKKDLIKARPDFLIDDIVELKKLVK